MKTVLVSSENSAAFRVFTNTIDSRRFNVVFWPAPSGTLKAKSRLEYMRWLLENTWFGCVVNVFFLKYFYALIFLRKLEKKIAIIQQQVSGLIVSSVIVASDRSITNDLAIIVWAQRNRVPVIVLEYAYSAGFEGASKSRKSKIFRSFLSESNSVIKGVRFYKPHHELSLKMLGLFPENPWVLGSGYSDSIIVSTNIEKKRLEEGGVSSSKIKVLGSVELDDVIARNFDVVHIRRDSCLVALPQYWEHNLLDKKNHFEVVNGLLRVLVAEFKCVYVSLHPKMVIDDYDDLLAKYGAILLHTPLKCSMHLADTFVGTYTSTVVWAAMLKKKIILVDHACLNYKEFYPELKLKVCSSNAELELLLKSGDGTVGSDVAFDYCYGCNAKVRINDFIASHERLE